MPIYEFNCREHGTAQALRCVADRDSVLSCPACGSAMNRAISAPHLAHMNPDERLARERNERSANEPQRARRASCGHTHEAGRACGSDQSIAKEASPGIQRAHPAGRPWMLGH